MPSPVEAFRSQAEAFIEDQLEKYKADLQHRIGSTNHALRDSTITAREKGAEDFALFLMGKTPKNERLRGAVKKQRG